MNDNGWSAATECNYMDRLLTLSGLLEIWLQPLGKHASMMMPAVLSNSKMQLMTGGSRSNYWCIELVFDWAAQTKTKSCGSAGIPAETHTAFNEWAVVFVLYLIGIGLAGISASGVCI